jgi:hypothetical protein
MLSGGPASAAEIPLYDRVSWSQATVQEPGTATVTIGLNVCVSTVRAQVVNLTTGKTEGTIIGHGHSSTAKFPLSSTGKGELGDTTLGTIDAIPCGGRQWEQAFPTVTPGLSRMVAVTAAARQGHPGGPGHWGWARR